VAVTIFRVCGFSHKARAKSAHQPGRDAIDADVVLSPLDREIARELEIGGFRDVVAADHRGALEAADGRDEDDRPVLALDHARRDHLHQPVAGNDVIFENLAELVVAHPGHRPVIGVGRRIADEHVDPPECGERVVDEALKLLLCRDVGGDGEGGLAPERGVDRARGLFAGLALARRDHDARAMFGEPPGDRLADAARRASDHSHSPVEIEQARHRSSSSLISLFRQR
jgi:hypothetical protein